MGFDRQSPGSRGEEPLGHGGGTQQRTLCSVTADSGHFDIASCSVVLGTVL